MTTEEKTEIAKAIFPRGSSSTVATGTNGSSTNDWHHWKAGVLAQLEDAEKKLREKLDAVQRAQGEIRAL